MEEVTEYTKEYLIYMREKIGALIEDGTDAGPFADIPLTPDKTRLFRDTRSFMFPGDVNEDGNVDKADFDIIRGNFLESVVDRTDGDLTLDGFVDWGDFRAWKNKASEAGGTGAAVPEPSTMMLLLTALTGALWARRRR